MADKHTPGPWHATPAGHIGSENLGFVPLLTPFREGAHKDKFGNPTPEALANARLIAAAPELLEALKGLRDYHHSPAMKSPRLMQLLHETDTAIKAAKGDA